MSASNRMESPSFPQNNSHQQLMADDSDGMETVTVPSISSRDSSLKGFRTVTVREWITVAVLCYVNLINYMDRYTIAGIMGDIKSSYELNNQQAGLLQTVFVISYMIFAPVFGYLGDRYSRKAIMACGVFLWSLTTLLGSFMGSYWGFLVFRGCVGIGEASYSTIAPTIISDLFIKDLRAKMLALFYFAIPVGSGLGYIVGAKTAYLTGEWQWALRVTPIMGIIAVVAIIFLVQEPVRGEAEGRSHLQATSWGEDLQYLVKNKSFMLSTAGFTCVAFVTGALAWWGPDYITKGVQLQPENAHITSDDVAFKFGIVTVISGALGVPLGQHSAMLLKKHVPSGDPLVCGSGLILSMPLVFAAMLTARHSPAGTFALVFFGTLLVNLSWSIIADMLLYVVIPTRRSTAEAFQILISHALGDAGSPYLIGVMTDYLKDHYKSYKPWSPQEVDFYSLQYSLFSTCFVEAIGGAFFLITAIYIVKDRLLAERSVRECIMKEIQLTEGLLTSDKITVDRQVSPMKSQAICTQMKPRGGGDPVRLTKVTKIPT